MARFLMPACAILLGLLVCVSSIDEAEAQWQTPQYSIPVGKGIGNTGFDSVGPCTSGYFVGGVGAGGNPTCQGFSQASSAVVRTWQDKARDVVSVKDFGAVGNGAADDTAAVSATLASLTNGCGEVYLPPGIYRLSGRISHTVSADCAVVIRGAGSGAVTLIWTNASGGFDITLSHKLAAIHFGGVTSTTTVAGGGSGFKCTNTSGDINESNNSLSSLTFRGYSGPNLSDYWTTAVELSSCSYFFADNVLIQGGSGTLGDGFSITGDPGTGLYAVGLTITRSTLNFLSRGVVYGSYVQGVSFADGSMNIIDKGVHVPSGQTGVLAQLTVVGSQITTTPAGAGIGIHTETATIDVNIAGTEFIVSAASSDAIYLAANAACTIVGNTIGSQSTTSTRGVVMGTNAGTYACTVANNRFNGFATGLVLLSGSSNVRAWPNVYDGNTAEYSDAGTSNLTEGQFNTKLSILGTLVDGIDLSGATITNSLLLPNQTAIKAKDSGGTSRQVLAWSNINAFIIGNTVFNTYIDSNNLFPLAHNTTTLGASGLEWSNFYTVLSNLGTVQSGTWNGASIGVGYGGTGLTSYTLGDMVYASDTTTLTKLAGNTSTTKMFLSQTGTGSVSAAPVWSAVSKSDVGLGSVENTALSTWAGSTNITTLGTIATGTWGGTTIEVNKGGTGVSTLAANGILYGAGTGAIGSARCALDSDSSILCTSSSSYRPAFLVTNTTNDDNYPNFNFIKGKGSATGAVSAGTALGAFVFAAGTGGGQSNVASIIAYATGAPSGSNVPTKIEFNTAPSGSGWVTALTIDDEQQLKFGTASVVANGSVATALSSVGPTGAHTTVQEWLVIKNSAGTIRYIPLF